MKNGKFQAAGLGVKCCFLVILSPKKSRNGVNFAKQKSRNGVNFAK